MNHSASLPLLRTPSFGPSVLVTDDVLLAARISSLFSRPGSYFPVMDGPRMFRPDASNEALRRRNAIVMTGARQVLLGGMISQATSAMRPGWKNCAISDEYDDHVKALRGVVKRPSGTLRWGRTNLGVGLYKARLERKELNLDLASSPDLSLILRGKHLLVACECGDGHAEVLASNLAFACDASFAVFPELSKIDRDCWLEEIYALGEGGDLTGRFSSLAQRARVHLGPIDFSSFRTVLFVTAGFPWGIATPEVATTHVYRYPDLGRAIVEGLWASQSDARGAKNALLIDPHTVEGSEIPFIEQALIKNGSLTRVVSGPSATSTKVQFLLDLLPHDIVVISSHAGDAPGERITYEYVDAEKRQRSLTVDRALGIGYDRFDDKFLITEYHRFHSLDGVDWNDKIGIAGLPVGSALTSWSAMNGPMELTDHIVNQEKISRVIGSMAIQLHDGVWLFNSQGFAPGAAPLFINNSCWSWHELSQRTTFAGARGYVGSLFPITDVEAIEVGQALFGKYLGQELPLALWTAQRDIYGDSGRRPYVMVGLPFIVIRPNKEDTMEFMEKAYLDGLTHWSTQATTSPHEQMRRNAQRFSNFLFEDLQVFRQGVAKFKRRPRH